MTLTDLRPALAPDMTSPDRPDASGTWTRLAPVALGALAFLLCVAWSNRVFLWSATPKSALLLVAVGPGLAGLGVLIARRDRVASLAGGFLLVAALSTLLAPEPLMALFGEYFSRTGLLFLAACLGLWALGRLDPARAAPALTAGILAGAAVNAAVAWLQISTDLGLQGLAPVDGRASGLLGNAVFLSGLCAGATWLALDWERRAERVVAPLVLTAFLAGAVQLSGSRSGLLAIAAAGVWFAVAHLRQRRLGRAAGVIAAIALGAALALVPAGSGSAGDGTRGSASSGLAPRVAVWEAGIRSVADRPLVGIGPGRFVEASSPRRDLVSVRYEGRDVLMADAHNVFVEILTTTGLLGLLAFATWLLLAAGGARGALAGFAALVGFTLLLEPLDLAVVPVAALALGAATVAGARAPAPPRLTRIAVVTGAVLALAGVVLGARLVAGDVAYASAVRSSSLTDVERAERLSPPWPQYPGLEAALLDRAGSTLGDPGLGARAMVVQRTAIDRDPSDPRWWYGMGELEQRWGSDARARRDYLAALQRNPWSYSALSRLYGLELRAGHRETALRFRARLCSIGPSECPPSPEVMEQQARTKPAAHPRASTR